MSSKRAGTASIITVSFIYRIHVTIVQLIHCNLRCEVFKSNLKKYVMLSLGNTDEYKPDFRLLGRASFQQQVFGGRWLLSFELWRINYYNSLWGNTCHSVFSVGFLGLCLIVWLSAQFKIHTSDVNSVECSRLLMFAMTLNDLIVKYVPWSCDKLKSIRCWRVAINKIKTVKQHFPMQVMIKGSILLETLKNSSLTQFHVSTTLNIQIDKDQLLPDSNKSIEINQAT